MKQIKKMALKLGIETYQILINDDEVCIPRLSNILLAVNFPMNSQLHMRSFVFCKKNVGDAQQACFGYNGSIVESPSITVL